MFSFFKPQSELAVVYDIGSTSVGAGLARISADGLAEITYTVRESIPYQKKLDSARLLKDMTAALDRANAAIAREGLSKLKLANAGDTKIGHVALGFSAPWVTSKAQVVTLSKEKPFTFTREIAARLLSEASRKTVSASAPLSVIEKRIVNVSLDGNGSAAPFGAEARKAEVSILASLMPKAVIDGAIGASAAAHHPESAKAFSFPVAMFSALRDIYHHADDFAFIDVGGEVSDLSLVRDGVMLETASFPFGRNFIARRIAAAFSISESESESLANLYLEKRLSTAVEERLRPTIDKAASEWLGAFKATLTRISGQKSAPADLYILSDDGFDHFCARLLAHKDMSVTEVGADRFAPIATFAPGTRKDPAIAIAAMMILKTSRLDIK